MEHEYFRERCLTLALNVTSPIVGPNTSQDQKEARECIWDIYRTERIQWVMPRKCGNGSGHFLMIRLVEVAAHAHRDHGPDHGAVTPWRVDHGAVTPWRVDHGAYSRLMKPNTGTCQSHFDSPCQPACKLINFRLIAGTQNTSQSAPTQLICLKNSQAILC